MTAGPCNSGKNGFHAKVTNGIITINPRKDTEQKERGMNDESV